MSDTLSIATNALNSAAARLVKATASMVNASSTGTTGDLTSGVVGIAEDKTAYAAEAKVIRAVAEDNKKLMDILA